MLNVVNCEYRKNMDGLGSITWWGFSPAIDFRSYLSLKDADKTDVIGFSGNSAVTRCDVLTQHTTLTYQY